MVGIDGEYVGEYTLDDLEVTLVGRWVIVKLRGRTIRRILKRTREQRWISVQFSTGRSPRYARTDQYLQGVEILVKPPRPTFWEKNDTRLVAPIPDFNE